MNDKAADPVDARHMSTVNSDRRRHREELIVVPEGTAMS